MISGQVFWLLCTQPARNDETGFCRLERIEGAGHEIFMESDLYRQPAFDLTLDFINTQVG
jgi:alpha-beta hydrolase superfamily lysophospholipase